MGKSVVLMKMKNICKTQAFAHKYNDAAANATENDNRSKTASKQQPQH